MDFFIIMSLFFRIPLGLLFIYNEHIPPRQLLKNNLLYSDMMKRLLNIVYTRRFVFGGFKDENRLFFVIPCLRISFFPYEGWYSLTIGFGILFWEFACRIEIEK